MGTYNSAGRTDRGVSALGMVVAFECDKFMLGQLNSALSKDVKGWAFAHVNCDFNPRFARERWYRYVSEPFENQEKVKKACAILKGEHSFHNFCRNDERDTVRILTKVSVENKGGYAVLDVKGESFLWQMVRRIATALRMVDGGLSLSEFEDLLRPEVITEIEPSRPDGLTLMDIDYGFEFREDKRWKEAIKEYLTGKLMERYAAEEIIHALS
jgi:tRNA pseudouridine38-40 synthase